MKKSTLARLGGLAMVLCLATMALFGGSLAKYTSAATGSDSATVAKWSFKVGNTDIAASENFDFDLFDDAKIKPGDDGSFSIILKNESDVDAQYAIDYTVNNAGVLLEFSTDNETWTTDLTDVSASEDTKLTTGSGEKTITVYWRWKYEQTDKTSGDVADTNLGATGTATPSVSATVTATQVNPSAQ